MAFDDTLGDKVRNGLLLDSRVRPDQLVEQKMFGGLAFMVGGHMAVGVVGRELLVRLSKEHYSEALDEPDAEPMVMGGRTMGGFVAVTVDEAVLQVDAEPASKPLLSSGTITARAPGLERFEAWLARGVDTALALPPKAPKSLKSAKRSRRQSL